MIKAKPIEWEETSTKSHVQWYDGRYGFSIVYDRCEDDVNLRYRTSWGEASEDCFASLEEAKQWCQDEIDRWVRENVVLEPSKLSREEVLKVEKTDHPDLVGGIVWADCELNWIRAYGIRCYETGVVKVAEDMRERLEEQRPAVIDAVAEALGDAYDCLRVWSAWGYGTMGQDDFSLVQEDPDRVAEIADAAISAIRALPITPTNTEGEQE